MLPTSLGISQGHQVTTKCPLDGIVSILCVLERALFTFYLSVTRQNCQPHPVGVDANRESKGFGVSSRGSEDCISKYMLIYCYTFSSVTFRASRTPSLSYIQSPWPKTYGRTDDKKNCRDEWTNKDEISTGRTPFRGWKDSFKYLRHGNAKDWIVTNKHRHGVNRSYLWNQVSHTARIEDRLGRT